MKKAALLLSSLLLSALFSGATSAEVVRVRVTGRVAIIDDTNGRLAGKVNVGQRLTGTYVYNTNTPNWSPTPQWSGEYRPYAGEARVRFVVGGLAFESKQPTQGIGISVQSHVTSGIGRFAIFSSDNKPLVDGTAVDQMWLEISGAGNVTESVALPIVAPIFPAGPNYPNYSQKRVTISTSSPAGNYSIIAELEAAELIVPDAIVVTPASGTFAANQHFDAAVILPRNSVVSTAQATANGAPLPLSYPGSCQLQPQVGTGKPSLLCPAADSVLSMQPGAPIEWTVQLTNGTVYTETVNWQRAP